MAFWETVLNSTDSTDAKLYGKRLIPTIVDDNVRQQPDRICLSFPRCYTYLRDGFQDVDWRCFANAINRMAHFIHKEIGRSSAFETLMYMGFPDIRTYIVLVAAIKTGHKILFSSHRNSLAGHSNLIRQTDCTVLLYTAGFPIPGILERCRLEAVQVPELAALLDGSLCQHYPYKKTFEEAKHDPCFVIHTSGSTGLPAPVVCTHWSISTTDQHHLVAPLDGRPSIWGTVLDARRRNYMAWPMSASSGVAAGITDFCFSNTTTVLGPPEEATASTIEDMIQYADIDSASCVPATLEELARSPDVLMRLQGLKHISYVGGSLSQHAGDAISQHVPLVCLMASTETVTMVQHLTDREDWSYVCIHPFLNGIEMRPVADLFELVYVRNPDCVEFQGVFKVFPDLLEYSMHDLYSKHPTKPYHWRHEGRKDDIIVFRNGSKFNPMLHERMIALHPKVHACMLVGTGRDKPAAIIELHPRYYTEDGLAQKALKHKIWLQASKANDVADIHGQLEQRYVIFSNKDKPFQMGLKGTVQRHATTRLYAQEIEELYASIADGGPSTLFQTESGAD
ncbi:catalytic [Ascochyta rabiei]|uniref:Catalytic n=1 Tax=Didymella rabiei TaxID=5454 RepID=A0A163CD26_DIDRA|nr:catalytic [Ascochyta rabiei]